LKASSAWISEACRELNCARMLSSAAVALRRLFCCVSESISATCWPFCTVSPRLTSKRLTCPDTCAPTLTCLKACKVPVASTDCSRSPSAAVAVAYCGLVEEGKNASLAPTAAPITMSAMMEYRSSDLRRVDMVRL
jgi:hypothetical protein